MPQTLHGRTNKRWRFQPHDADRIARLEQAAGISPIVAQLLISRGVYDHEQARWYWREIEAQDRRYGAAMGVYVRGEVLDENYNLIRRFMHHDLGSFGYVPATRDRGATGVALYAYSQAGQYFDDVCVDAVSARSEDDETDSLVWNTTNVPAGAYYIYAVISDGTHTVRQYSPGRILVRHERSSIPRESAL